MNEIIRPLIREQAAKLFESGLPARASEHVIIAGDFLPQALRSRYTGTTHYFLGLRSAETTIKVVPVGCIDEDPDSQILLKPLPKFHADDLTLLRQLTDELTVFCDKYEVAYNLEMGT